MDYYYMSLYLIIRLLSLVIVSMRQGSLNYSVEDQPSTPRDPHKFPKYKIKNTSVSKQNFHQRTQSNQTCLTFKNISPSFSKDKNGHKDLSTHKFYKSKRNLSSYQ